MMKRLLSLALVAAFSLGLVGASLAQTSVIARLVGGGGTPALTSCGGGTPAIVGTDLAGTVTMGTSATGCIITFAQAYVAAPHCVVTWIATPLASQSYVTAAATITLTQTSTSSNVVKYFCVGQN